MSAGPQSANSVAQAVELWRSGLRQQAERMCELLARDDAKAGDGARPAQADALSLLAEIYNMTKRGSEELASLRRLVRLKPQDAAVWRRLGNAALARGEWAEAVSSYQHSLRIEPANPRGHNNLGQALMRLNRRTEALASYRRATQLAPDYVPAHYNLGIALQEEGEREAALASYERALMLDPNNAPVLTSASNLLTQLQRPMKSLAYRERALRCEPQNPDAQNNRASALNALGRYPEALVCCQQALALRPEFPEAFAGQAIALRELYRYEEARAACERALELRPDYMTALCTLAEVLNAMGEQQAAGEYLRRILELEPDRADARMMAAVSRVPILPLDASEVSSSRVVFAEQFAAFAEWVGQNPVDELSLVGASTPFYLAYQDSSNRELLVRHGTLCCELMSRWQRRQVPTRPHVGACTVRKARVAVISAHIRDHSVYRALVKGWIEQLDRSHFEVGVIHLGSDRDAETTHAQARADFFIEGARSLGQWVETIQSLDLDVLIFPEIGMNAMTLQLASLRLARLQLAAWGHPETTGLPTIDYYLSAQYFEPPHAQDHYSERLVPLPGVGCYYQPYEECPSAVDLDRLGIDADRPILLCPGMPFKYAPQYDNVLAAIARRLQRCQLVFFEAPVPRLTQRLRERVATVFRANDLDPDACLVSVPWQPRAAFFGLMQRADVLLDSVGFSGFNTIMQAFETGLPLVAFEGRFMRGRFGSGLMRAAALPDLVATTTDEYIELAVRLATDAAFRGEVRTRMQVGKERLFRDRAAIDGLAEFLTEVLSRNGNRASAS